MKADLRSEGDAALAASAAERMSLRNVRDRRTGATLRDAGRSRAGRGDVAGAIEAPAFAWKGIAWEIGGAERGSA